MSRWRRFLELIIRNDFAPIEFILALQLAFGSFWILSPWYVPRDTPSLSTATSEVIGWVFAIWMGAIGIIHLIALFWLNWPKRRQWRKTGAWNLTVIYTFIALLRGGIQGFSQIIWLSVLALGLIAAICYINLAVRDE